MSESPFERWPGYDEQSWPERFAELDRRHTAMMQDIMNRAWAAAAQHPQPQREANIAAALLHHAIGGPWAQYRQEFKFAADCGCGKTFFGQTAPEARTAWAQHVASTLPAAASVEAGDHFPDAGKLVDRAAVAELVEALTQIVNLSDSEMADGDGARDLARQAISRHLAGLGKGDDRG